MLGCNDICGYMCNNEDMSETKNIRLAGHAFQPKKNPYGRNVIPGCECGETIGNAGPVNMKTARFVHYEHKRQIQRDASRLEVTE